MMWKSARPFFGRLLASMEQMDLKSQPAKDGYGLPNHVGADI